MKKLRVNGTFVAFAVLGIGTIAASIFGGYYYWKYQSVQLQASNQPAGQNDENTQLLARVRAMIEVPEDEEPTIASVKDREKLRDQQFFANAQNGDRVLIFSSVKKAILFRPSSGKIIDVAPITVGTNEDTVKPASFVLYNGTDVTGFTKTYEATLKASVASAVIVDRDNAAKRDYGTSMLVDLSGTKSTVAAELAKTLDLEVSTLPAGETKPAGADFLIILGADKSSVY